MNIAGAMADRIVYYLQPVTWQWQCG